MNKYSDLELRSYTSKILPPLTTPKHHSLILHDFAKIMLPTTPNVNTNRISVLTQLENERAFKAKTYELTHLQSIKETNNTVSSYSKADFLSLIRSLEMVSSNQSLDTCKILYEVKKTTVSIDHGACHNFQINCKDKRSPVIINIRRKQGKARYFYSKTIENPNINQHDQLFLSDNFEISDYGLRFAFDSLYFTIEALTNLICTIDISFGKLKVYIPPEPHESIKNNAVKAFEELRKNEDLRNQLKTKVEKLMQKRKQNYLKLSGSKNYLQLNKNITASISEKYLNNWDEKKDIVLQRKYEKYLEKKQQALKSLKKKSIQIENELFKREEHDRKEKKSKTQENWFKILYFLKIAFVFRQKWLNSRKDIIDSLQINTSARLIQRVFKKKQSQLSLNEIILLHASDNLILYNQVLAKTMKNEAERSLIKFISASAVNNNVTITFNSFIAKVSMIQKASKAFLSKNKKRIEDITKLWNAMIAKIISRSSSTHVNKYIKITSHTRKDIIKEYYSNKLLQYMIEINRATEKGKLECNKLFIQDSENLEISSNIRSDFSSNAYSDRTLIKQISYFNYLPSESELREMIEKAASTQ